MAQDHTFRVTHERTGKVAYDGLSYTDAASAQYRENVEESNAGLPPLYRLWLVDIDGIAVIVSTQL